MSRYSVEIGNPPKVYDVVVGQPDKDFFKRRMVTLVRSDNKHAMLLCEVWPHVNRLSGPNTWNVIVHPREGDGGDDLIGPTMVRRLRQDLQRLAVCGADPTGHQPAVQGREMGSEDKTMSIQSTTEWLTAQVERLSLGAQDVQRATLDWAKEL